MSRTTEGDVAPPGLPGYRFIRHIGSGGNAQVYLYEQELPHRKVAVKVLNESALSEAARRRFTAEANVTAGLAHRHIVQVFDANVTPDGRPYIVMPYYPQPNLSVRARRSHFSVADVLRTGIQIGSAVETSHQRDVLHRDIKPQNILADSYGEPALTDFGIATTTGGDGPEGLSVPWSPPEILYGTAPGDQRSDVYSLGATLWHLLAGRSPFEEPGGDNSAYALMRRIKSDPPPRTQRADVPDSLERLLRQSMAKDPAARPQSAMELIRGLQSVEQELRLPLTQPILPAGEPSPDTRGGDTIVRARTRDGETAAGRGPGPRPATQDARQPWGQANEPPRGPEADSRTFGIRPAVQPQAWSGGADDDATRTRGPMRLDPRGAAGQAVDDPTRARGPARLDPRGGAQQGAGTQRPWEFAPQTQDASTFARPTVLRPGDPAMAGEHRGPADLEPASQFGTSQFATSQSGTVGTPPERPRGRVIALAGGGMLLAVAVAAFLVFGLGSGQPGPATTGPGQATSPGGAQDALGPGAPGQPVVTAERAGATKVRFHWTYASHKAGDTFRWRRVSGTAGSRAGRTAKPQLLVTVPPGQVVCVVVQVIRVKNQASDESEPACWPR